MRRILPGSVVLLALTITLVWSGCGGGDTTKPSVDPPEIAALAADFPVVQAGDSVTVHCSATCREGEALSYSWTCSAGAIAGDDSTVVWVAPAAGGSCTIAVTVADSRGGEASESVTVESVAGTLLIDTGDGLVAADFTGGGFVLTSITTPVEVLGTRIFQMGYPRVYEIDHQGNTINTIIPSDPEVEGHNFFVLPDGGFAFVTNWSDSVYFLDAAGALEFKGPLPEAETNTNLQCIYGRVVGNRLIVSETGTYKLAAFDLDTFEGSIYRDLPGRGWLGAIHHHEGMFYLASCELIRKFTGTGDPADVCIFPSEGCWTGLTWAGGYLWGVKNREGILYRIDPESGEVVTVLEGLDYPQDLEYLPVVLEEPTGS